MRILFLSSIYPRQYTRTLGVYCHALCRALAVRHDVRVVAPVGWVERLRRGDPARAPAATGDPPCEFVWYFYPPKVLRSSYGWFMWRSVRQPVVRALRDFAPDCVLSYWLHPDGEAAVRAARSSDIPSAVIVGGSDALLLPRDPARRRSIKRVLDEADALITVSCGLRNKVVELGAPASKVHVIYQGIERGLFAPGDRAAARARLGLPLAGKALLWVGAMVPVKALDVLLDALARLRRTRDDFHLYLVGDGPLRSALAARAAADDLAGCVTFVDPLAHVQLPDWYRAADLTVLPSWSEGIPNVLRESLACGTPFVATRVGDIAEFCPEADAELVPPGDPTALADALDNALAGRGVRPTLSRPAGWDEYADEVASLLDGLQSGRPWRPADQRPAQSAVGAGA
jgi:glycosyltransferase involved in cell wall biosynthesis